MSKEHTYTNGDVTIIWKAELCIHSKKCWTGLGEVFKPGQRPWIEPNGATTQRIIDQVELCPSGALSYRVNNAVPDESGDEGTNTEVEVADKGPLLLKGNCVVKHPDGRTEIREKTTAFCRCGASANKPYCDGSHRKIDFQG